MSPNKAATIELSKKRHILLSHLKAQIQGILVPKLTLGPFLTLNVRNGHKLIDWVFRIPAHIESKSRKKNNNQHFIKHEEDNKSQF